MPNQDVPMTDFAAARLNMIESQVRPNGITDRRIIAAMERVARENFVPESRRSVAYVDEDVPLQPSGNGHRALIEAMAFARLLQHAAVKPGDKALMIGAGSGYGAAVIAQLARSVVAVESDAGLVAEARRNLSGLANVKVIEGPLPEGVGSESPFDVIVLEGRVSEVPAVLTAQLAEGGRLVAITGDGEMGEGCVFTRAGGAVTMRKVFNGSVAALPGFEKKKPAFVF